MLFNIWYNIFINKNKSEMKANADRQNDTSETDT